MKKWLKTKNSHGFKKIKMINNLEWRNLRPLKNNQMLKKLKFKKMRDKLQKRKESQLKLINLKVN